MRASILALGALGVSSASASFLYPDIVPIHRRQAPGTPEYNCHANCGGVIVDARTDGYCDTANFTTALDACLDCALEYDIWQYYGDSVSSAAEACGLETTPHAASSTSETSGSAIPTSTLGAESSSVSAEASIVASPIEAATTTAVATSTVEETGSATASHTSSGTAAVETFQGGGSRVLLPGMLAVILLGAMVAELA
ncbi:hypothetical protein A1O3_08299 [Capronia epimyces CBS 606.96]|uniref:Extracellular membrane protein CFEM domain-containing protein n=1 Tax=Capronia epimyces CBS 606.96 TaxID=1182542 RepID=W9XII3_9EURO|nr:uncharacterized protein A1O3_08299 [Capronia epimyces CBS 606.96]EXJ80013.1 hypothetical protein A1O3_08299 [Capronia epimyces CBS 606.96]